MVTDLRHLHDASRPLANPGKGWYHHYYDNDVETYLPESPDELIRFPGMDHLYVRIPWCHVEPEPDKIEWHWIDDLVKTYTPHGIGIAYGITCKETGEEYATPRWVFDLGAAGQHYPTTFGNDAFAPEYGDPIFLARYEKLHQRLAERYADQPWLRYIDTRSFGDWGEGHTSFSTRKKESFETLREHGEILKRCYPNVPITVSDDYVHTGCTQPEKLAAYYASRQIAYRDDSVLVRYYVDNYPESFSLRSPELFESTYLNGPTNIELQHYRMMINPAQDNTWRGKDGSEFGADILRGAIRQTHASYLGYHGDASTWLNQNPALTLELLNMVGYWLFPVEYTVDGNVVEMTFENRGVAPAYEPLTLEVENAQGARSSAMIPPAAWDTGINKALVHFAVGQDATPVRFRLVGSRPIMIGVLATHQDEEGWVELTS